MPNPAAVIIGAGDATGGAIARVFAAEGLTACVNRRTRNAEQLEALAQSIRDEGHKARAFPADARDEEAMIALFDQIEAEVGAVEVAVFNIGANVNFPIAETTVRVYTKVWEMACLGGFLMGREAAKRMSPRGRGTIIFTGATASLRGGSGFAAFAGAKGALRMLAQSMARELGPQGIHVAHTVIDGAIDTEFIKGRHPDFDNAKAQDLILNPGAIAANYVMLHNQPKSAWTHELDLRPWGEKW
ncbi:NAD(P)-dependent dehydrogenase (short-subunit alcohol dehydrogenase family) [Sphingopyxis italica]|uniref:NAD(P)-dependent dehydrogenase (Short-subunit alcohol dehydrogenase family) n=1 Tax=Sphingopyxis italica TaxID=1129133 RepID=A0A7X5XS97_9SPHN|nr:SDR family NAD(P)-dependent oxidoreductase [Sphingopyxis italica]NJB90372.1 NAD(P)-dependent dehydrogenase (short-subunit alcohol dehydrogenase family) [Sphingopyxis italica]